MSDLGSYDHWKTTEPDHDQPNRTAADDEREELYAQLASLLVSRDELLAAAKPFLSPMGLSERNRAREALRAAIAHAEELAP